MIAVPITASTAGQAVKDAERAHRIAELVELRLDLIKDIGKDRLNEVMPDKPGRAIVTDRKNRAGIIEEAIRLKAGFVDIDICRGKKEVSRIIKGKGKTKIIVSYHNFKKTDEKELIKKYEEIKGLKPDVIKIASFANSIMDNLPIFRLIKRAKKEKRKIIALCMGEKGKISRILSVPFGAELTFGSLEEGKESAPGQIPACTLIDRYRVNELKDPKVFGLAGNPVGHSKGMVIHNKAFEKLGMNSIYVNFLVEDIGRFIDAYKGMISGLSITIPFKTEIVKYLDRVDATAESIGAVNTVVKENGKLMGHNTDAAGAIKAIEEKTGIEGKEVLMVGAGGAAKAIGYGIIQNKGKLTIANRTESKAKKLAGDLGHGSEGIGINVIGKLEGVDIVINATSIGMFPDTERSPIEKGVMKKIIGRKTVVFDAVYNPRETMLLKMAAKLGCKTVSGYEMFINQAEEQFRMFTGKRASLKGTEA
ncbi:shikimate dehydrogenase [Candidatus Woesearchaeota archaeon]|nr:shikimate dehydrogenase [Candidatus Woesearchaeota archaeon]